MCLTIYNFIEIRNIEAIYGLLPHKHYYSSTIRQPHTKNSKVNSQNILSRINDYDYNTQKWKGNLFYIRLLINFGISSFIYKCIIISFNSYNSNNLY